MALSYDSNMSAPYPSLPYPNSIPTSPPLSTSPSPSPSTTSTTSSSQFPLFTHLPPELRLKIWLLTLPPPRLVPLTYTSITSTSPPSLRGCTSPAAIPVTLHINHESRVLALSYYTLSFGLSGSISTSPSLDPSISPSSSLENKIYFSPARNDILFFGLPTHHATHQQTQQEAIKSFLHACTLVSPTSIGFGAVKRLAVQKSLFTSPSTPYPSPSWIEGGGAGGKTTTLHLRIFWERIRRSFTSVEEVLFVDNPSDALIAFNENDSAFGRNGDEGDGWIKQGSGKSEGLCWPGDELGVWCWERERFGGMVGRVVGCVEGEWGWVAPRWRVVGCRMGEEGCGEVEVEARRRKEEGLVRRMRELFGHEGVSNAVC